MRGCHTGDVQLNFEEVLLEQYAKQPTDTLSRVDLATQVWLGKQHALAQGIHRPLVVRWPNTFRLFALTQPDGPLTLFATSQSLGSANLRVSNPSINDQECAVEAAVTRFQSVPEISNVKYCLRTGRISLPCCHECAQRRLQSRDHFA